MLYRNACYLYNIVCYIGNTMLCRFFFFIFSLAKKHFYTYMYIRDKKKKKKSFDLSFRDWLAGWLAGVLVCIWT